MYLIETVIFYLLVGSGVAVAVYLRSNEGNTSEIHFQVSMAFLFWPLFVPLLLSSTNEKLKEEFSIQAERKLPEDELTSAISQVEKEFEAALRGLDGWAENVLSTEKYRLEELRSAWNMQADRIRELDRLLARPETEKDSLVPGTENNQRARESEKTRKGNIKQLREIRNQMHLDLLGTLAWVRELVTMIHLAKFSGAPASRAEELIAQIASAVEGLSEVSNWNTKEEPVVN